METPGRNDPPSLKRALLLITYAILLFLIIYRIEAAWSALTWFFRALSPLFVGVALAFAFHLPMDFFQYKVLGRLEHHRSAALRKLWPGLSMALAYVSVILFFIGLVALIIPRAIESVQSLMMNFAGYLKGFQSWIDGALSSLSLSPEASGVVTDVWERSIAFLQSLMGGIVSGALNFTWSFTTGVMDFVLSLMFSGFILYNRRSLFSQLRKLFSAILGKKRVERIAQVARLSDHIFGRFIMGQIVEALILGVLCFFGMVLFQMDYALLISTIIALTALIPILGAIIGTVPCAVILLVIDPMQALWFVVFIIVLQQIEGNFIYPRVVGNAIGLSGLWVLASLIIGGGLFGIWGMLLGTPIFAVIYHLIDRWLDTRERTGAH